MRFHGKSDGLNCRLVVLLKRRDTCAMMSVHLMFKIRLARLIRALDLELVGKVEVHYLGEVLSNLRVFFLQFFCTVQPKMNAHNC